MSYKMSINSRRDCADIPMWSDGTLMYVSRTRCSSVLRDFGAHSSTRACLDLLRAVPNGSFSLDNRTITVDVAAPVTIPHATLEVPEGICTLPTEDASHAGKATRACIQHYLIVGKVRYTA